MNGGAFAGTVVASVFGAIIFLVIDYLISSEFQKIAEEKGYTDTKYKWLCFFFGIAGMLIVVALPDLELKNSVLDYLDLKKSVSEKSRSEQSGL